MSSAIIPGTRPEIIKMSPVIREFERRGMDYFILLTGQHYSYNMDRVFFEQLKLPEAKYNLEAGSGAKEQGNKETVIYQTGLTGSTGFVSSFDHVHPVIPSRMKKPQMKAPRVTSLQSRASGGRIHVCLRAYVGTKSRSVRFRSGEPAGFRH